MVEVEDCRKQTLGVVGEEEAGGSHSVTQFETVVALAAAAMTLAAGEEVEEEANPVEMKLGVRAGLC